MIAVILGYSAWNQSRTCLGGLRIAFHKDWRYPTFFLRNKCPQVFSGQCSRKRYSNAAMTTIVCSTRPQAHINTQSSQSFRIRASPCNITVDSTRDSIRKAYAFRDEHSQASSGLFKIGVADSSGVYGAPACPSSSNFVSIHKAFVSALLIYPGTCCRETFAPSSLASDAMTRVAARCCRERC